MYKIWYSALLITIIMHFENEKANKRNLFKCTVTQAHALLWKSIMHPCVTNIHPYFQDEDAGDETCFFPTDYSIYACARNSRVVLLVFSSIIIKLDSCDMFTNYLSKCGGLMW